MDLGNVEPMIDFFKTFCWFFFFGGIFFSVVVWWDSTFDDYYESLRVNEIEGGEDTGDGFINAAMFQDME